jgi:hypothetical protein
MNSPCEQPRRRASPKAVTRLQQHQKMEYHASRGHRWSKSSHNGMELFQSQSTGPSVLTNIWRPTVAPSRILGSRGPSMVPYVWTVVGWIRHPGLGHQRRACDWPPPSLQRPSRVNSFQDSQSQPVYPFIVHLHCRVVSQESMNAENSADRKIVGK